MALPEKLEELAIMLTARYWSTQLEWIAHSRSAVKAGLSEEKAKAIAEGKRPDGLSPDEESVYNFITELYKNKGVSDATFAAAKNQVGERGVVDLMLSSGFYQFVSMTMAIDRLPLGNLQPQLAYLAKPLP
jgi:4-carboxymuconolactone decarboxylase